MNVFSSAPSLPLAHRFPKECLFLIPIFSSMLEDTFCLKDCLLLGPIPSLGPPFSQNIFPLASFLQDTSSLWGTFLFSPHPLSSSISFQEMFSPSPHFFLRTRKTSFPSPFSSSTTMLYYDHVNMSM